MIKDKIQYIVASLEQKLASYEELNDSSGDAVLLFDPVARRVVGSHYALSHYFGGLCIQAYFRKDQALKDKAGRLFKYIYATHDKYAAEYDYHYDFNNFIWAVLFKLDQEFPGLLSADIREKCCELLLKTGDSNHFTVNWLPMRAFNNAVRNELRPKRRYRGSVRKCLKQALSARNPDGLFDDYLKPGLSANPQYLVFTVIVLLTGIKFGVFDYSSEEFKSSMQWLHEIIDPEGDFNYFGRGMNQLFGWGPMLLLQKNMPGGESFYDKSLSFVAKHIQQCLDNDGILLENSYKNQHLMWRFYHYASVYQAHMYFWTSMAQHISIPASELTDRELESKNISVYSDDSYFAMVFNGRSGSLAERGPMLCNLWTSGGKTLFKGPFGPFRPSENIAKWTVISAYLGLMEEKAAVSERAAMQTPVFPKDIAMSRDQSSLKIVYKLGQHKSVLQFNLPVFSKLGLTEEQVNEIFSVEAEGVLYKLYRIGSAIGEYHEMDIYRTSRIEKAENIVLKVNNK